MGVHEHVKFWHDTALSNLELLHATYVTHTFALHTHEGYVIGVIEQGAEQFTYRNQVHLSPHAYQIQVRIMQTTYLVDAKAAERSASR